MPSKETENGCEDDIVISGLSGRFPLSRNVDEFEYNLYNKINMVNDDESRFKHTNPAVPRNSGKIPDISKFDATFFGVTQEQADYMDPQVRVLIEESFKAIMDAGINPRSLRGTNTGVYVGSSVSETASEVYYNKQSTKYSLTGCSKPMFANRISYALGLNGPSLLCDTACSSAIYALDLAFRALQNGDIDAAIVGGANLCMHPKITLQFALLGVLSPTGTCRPFDADANGYTRSEAVSCIFLQRRGIAKRIYATIVCSRSNCDGFKLEGITYPSAVVQEKLLRETYNEANINMNDLGYIEAHCTSTVVGDPEECKAIDKAICSQRSEPLYIGSVKSNCGHAEPAAGMCSIVKVLLTLHNGIIPPNINFSTIKKSIDALVQERLKVVTTPTALLKPYAGANSFGFGGANAHVLLKQNDKTKMTIRAGATQQLHRLITWTGRTEETVRKFFAELEKQPLDEEYLALVQGAHEGGIEGMVYRGYSVLMAGTEDKPAVRVLSKGIQHWSGAKRPLVFVFGGLSTASGELGHSLTQLAQFQDTIRRCHNTLKPAGLDLVKIVNDADFKSDRNLLHSIVRHVAMQIAFVDILKQLNVLPDYVIGYSLGELACAYADDCLTLEQTILCAYYYGKVSLDSKPIKSTTAAIPLSHFDLKPLLPSGVEIVSHRSKHSCMIAGPSGEIKSFVALLKSKQIAAQDVPCARIAYHSQHVASMGAELQRYLKHVITDPKLRTFKWISTSVPQHELHSQQSRYSSAEYHTNTLLRPVLFEEAFALVPKHAITFELTPQTMLQQELDSLLPKGVHRGLNELGAIDGLHCFLDALGALYVSGVELHIEKLYPPVNFPVSCGTRALSSLIDFDHSQDYFVCNFTDNNAGSGVSQFNVKLTDQYQYLAGHEIDGRVLAPATFYLECAWRAFATMHGSLQIQNLAVEFSNIKFERATTLTNHSITQLSVTIHKASGKFEVTESDSLVACGYIRKINDASAPKPIARNNNSKESPVSVSKKSFYKELKLRGYHYRGDFQAVEMALGDGSYGKIKWIQNWVTFMDCMLQLSIVGQDSRTLMLPTRLRTLRIYPEYHRATCVNDTEIEVFGNQRQARLVSGGIEIIGLVASAVQRRRVVADPVLETYKFVPHFPAPTLSLVDIARCCVQLALENQPRNKLQIVELAAEAHKADFVTSLLEAVSDLPLITGECTIVHTAQRGFGKEETLEGVTQLYSNEDFSDLGANIVIINDLRRNIAEERSAVIIKNMDPSGYIISRERTKLEISKFKPPPDFLAIACFPTATESYVILKRKETVGNGDNIVALQIDSTDTNYKWLSKLQELCKTTTKQIVLVSNAEKFSGILGLVNCLRKEPETKNIRCLFLDKTSNHKIDTKLSTFASQLSLELAINVYRNGQWGTYRHLKLNPKITAITHSEHVYGNILQIGDFSTLKWLQGPLTKGIFQIKIIYSALNFRDVMQASGRIPIGVFGEGRLGQTCNFGLEYSGITADGKQIMGMTSMGAVASHLPKPPPIFWEVPKGWSLRDAATVPVVYLTVYYAYFYTANVKRGQSILIHAGSGGVGLAAIRVALAYGLEVFTTVSTKEKTEFLLTTFPLLNAHNIGNSRDVSFEDMIMTRTEGKGVDYVLNSLAEEKLRASVRCLARGGHFMEIGKFDMASDNELGLGVFLNELTFHAILADQLLVAKATLLDPIKRHMQQDIDKGIIVPLPSTVFAAHEIDQAFRYMMSGKHIGKILLQVRENASSELTLPIPVLPQAYFSPDLAYVVPGGLGGFGLELVDWMILRGARKLVLSSSRGLSNDYQKLRIALWKSYGCDIAINTADIGTESGCSALIKQTMELAPVGGIFNLAVVLKDAIFPNQTIELFQQSFKPKVFATLYLDQISRKLCPKLQHFVIFSSVSCGRGNAGQTNYGMANSIMERIIEDRVAHGLPGKAVQWGAVGEVGLVAEMAEGKIDLEIGGTLQQRISSCLDVLDVLLSTADPVVASMVVAEKKANSAGQSPVEFVLNTMSIRDIKSVSMTATLAELGMDSLMSVEIRQAFERDYDISVNTSDLRSLTFAKLMEISENAIGTGNAKSSDTTNDTDSIEHMRQLYGNVVNLGDESIIFDYVNSISEGEPIIVFPGIDGCSGPSWQSLAQRLQFPTYVLQFHQASSAKTLSEMAQFATQQIADFLEARNLKTFRILAYSMGTVIAHHTIKALESKGYQGKVALIDGSPLWLQTLMNSLQSIYIDIELDKMVLAVALSLLIPKLKMETIRRDLRFKLIKEDWMKYIHDHLCENNCANVGSTMDSIEAIYQRLKIIENPETYNNIIVIEAEILLLKPAIMTVNQVDEYYGLSILTKNSVRTETLEGNHQTILQNSKLPDVINNYFE